MAGIMIPILRKTSYDLTNLANAGKSIVLLEPYVDTVHWREGTVVLRLHTTPTWGVGAKIELSLMWTDQCADDPGIFFFYPGSNAAQATILQSDASVVAGYLRTATATSGLLGTMGVGVTFTQATTAASYLVTISADLFLKA